MKILLLEDDAILGDILYTYLKESGYDVMHAEDGKEALEFIEEEKFDMLIFDINVPYINGLDVLKSIREFSNTTPVIMITAYQDTEHLKKGFEFGCDDYIKKPFDLEELGQRVKNLAKRYALDAEGSLSIGTAMELYLEKNLIIKEGKEHHIANKESKILGYLLTRKGRVVSFEELIQNIWEYEDMPSETTVRVYIKNLRNIIGKEKIRTIRGIGYSFE